MDAGRADPIHSLLVGLQRHLRLDVCFVSEIQGDRRQFRFVEGSAGSFGIELDAADPLAETFCHQILQGTLPNVVTDARTHEVAGQLQATQELDIGAHIGVPIVLPTGRVYGTLCAVGHAARPDLDERDLGAMRVVAELIAELLAERLGPSLGDPLEVEAVLADPDGVSLVYQPILDLRTGRIVGHEGLARFAGADTAAMFAEAWRIGLGEELELRAVATGLADLDQLPADTWLSVNISPRAALSQRFTDLIDGIPGRRLVIEVTEHDAITRYEELSNSLEGVLDRGVRLAIDDIGTGYASLAHIVELSPDILKLDGLFARDIERGRSRRALANAFVRFANDIDAHLVVEGIETIEQLDTLRSLGIEFGQGFHLGRPLPAARLGESPADPPATTL